MRAINTYLLMALLILSFAAPAVQAEGIEVSLTVVPEPLHSQVNAYQGYMFQVAVENRGVVVSPGESVDVSGQTRYTGRVIVSLRLTIRGKGNYDFGESTTGYTTPPREDVELSKAVAMPVNGTMIHVSFNYTFTKDAYDYDLKPYEDAEVTVKAAAYYEVYDQATGPTVTFRGPEMDTSTAAFHLIDETKIAYVEGKLKDMADEVSPIASIDRPEFVDAELYLDMLQDMNASIVEGDYFTALATYRRYDEKFRQSLIGSLTREAARSRERAGLIAELEWQVQQLEATLEQEMNRLQLELDQEQARYAALSQTYQLKQAELEEAKQSLTTAITAVFLASIAFFFLGRRSTTMTLFEPRKTNQEDKDDDASPGAR